MAGVDRGVSTVVGYVLNVGIATLLITGLLIAGTGLVEDQRERTVRTELDVIGNRLAADIETADRLLRTGNATVTVRSTQPETVAGSGYSIEVLTADGSVSLRLEANRVDVSRRVPVRNVSPVAAGTVSGGDLTIERSGDHLVVSDG
jgi:hypothetical protein